MHKRIRAALAGVLGTIALLNQAANAGTLTIESWRTDDKALWEGVLIPAFAKAHPGISVKFAPTAPSEYEKNGEGLDFGAFPPPVKKAGDACYISDHTDIGMGINTASKNKADAKVFLDGLASPAFADLYTNKVTGLFSLSNSKPKVENAVAAEMLGWRNQCKSTTRLNAQILNHGTPSLEKELWTVNSQVLNGKMTPKEAAERIQGGFGKRHTPGK